MLGNIYFIIFYSRIIASNYSQTSKLPKEIIVIDSDTHKKKILFS